MRSIIESPWALGVGTVVAVAGGFRSVLLGVLLAVAWLAGWLMARRWWRGAVGRSTVGKVILGTGLAIVGLFVLVQAIPYGWSHNNPAVVAEPSWDSPTTRSLAVRACFDCHSNETSWPWYSDIAPISWLAYNHVVEGRATLDFSEWNRRQEVGEVAESIGEGAMPPLYYRLLHPSAALSAAEKTQLIDGLNATLSGSPPG
jgi:hypothetical protein